MADTYTTNLNLTKPEPGAAEDTWGISLNADLDSLDAIFGSGGTAVSMGAVTLDGLTVDSGSSDINIVFDDDSVTNRFKFTTGGNSLDSFFDVSSGSSRASHIRTISGSVSFDIASGFSRNDINFSNADLFIKRSGTKALEVDHATGDVSFYDDTGTSQNLKWDASADSLNFVDNAKATFGASNDLSIFHDGSSSYIVEQGQGSLIIRGGLNTYIQNTNGVTMAAFGIGGTAQLRYNGSTKLHTQNTGVEIFGTATMDGLTVDGTSILDSETNFVPNSTASNKSLVLASSGATGGTGQYGASLAFSRINTDSPRAAIAAVNTDSNFERMGLSFWTHQDNTVSNMVKRMQIDHDGDISFYDDSGTTQGLFWDSSAESLGIGTTSPSSTLHVDGDTLIKKNIFSSGDAVLKIQNGGNTGNLIDAQVWNGSAFETSFVATQSGSVGIGTDSPQAKLQIDDGDFYFKNDAYSDNNRIGFGNPARNGDAGYIDYIGHGNFTGHIAFGLVTSASNTAATEVARFDNAGNFGLGTSSPDTILEAEGATAEIRVTATTTNGGIGLHALSTNASTRNWDIRSNSSGLGTLDFRYGSSQGAAPSNVAMTMNSSGNVGIGTTSPNYLLDVEGSGSLLRVNSTSGNNIVQLSVPDTTSITGVNFGDSGSTNAGYIWYRHNGDSLAFTTAGTEALRILANGNVGIGTSSPSLPLSVAHTSTTAYATSKSFNVGGAVQIVNQSNTAGTFASLELNAGTAFAATASISVINENGSSNSASTLTFATRQSGTANIVEAMRIDSSGRVGIGTDSPSGLLEISADSDDGTSAPSFLITNASTTLNDGAVVGTIEFRNSDASGTPPHTAKIQGIANASDERTTELAFSTGSVGTTTEGMRLNSTGLGIGTDSPVGNLHVHSSTTESIMQMTNSSTGSGIADGFRFGAVGTSVAFINREAGSMSFSTSNTEAGRFDTSGNFLVAQSSIDTNTVGHIFLQNGSAYHIRDGGTTGIFNRKTSDGTIVAFQKDGSDVGSIGVDNSNNLYIQGDTTNSGLQCGTNAVLPHQSGADVDATIALGGTTRRFTSLHISDSIINDNASGVIKFRTNGSEAGRFDTSGRLLVGTTSDGGDGISLRPRASGTSTTSQIRFNRADTTNSGIALLFMNNTQAVGQISHTNTATTYATSSDARLKDVTGEARGLEVITKLNPVAYNWKADGKADEGLIAQEVKELVPNAVTGSEDEHYQMDYSKLVTHLVKGMKEQQEQIEFLKEEIANLKGE